MEPDASCDLRAPADVDDPGVAPRAAGTPRAADRAPRRPAAARVLLHRLLSAARPPHYRAGFYVFAAFLVALFVMVNLRGPCLQMVYGHDAIGFLGSAWKVRCGLWPHADYHSALGALNPWMYAAGMWLLGPTASVLPFCNALAAVALGLLAWAVASTRLPALPAAVFAFTQTVVAATAHLLRFDWPAASYDGCYNRQGYALVCVLLLLLFLPRRREDAPGSAARDGRVAGAILGVLLFLKVSYFMGGVGLGVLACVRGRGGPRAFWWNALAAFAGVAAACLPLIRFDVLAMLGDLRMAAAARAGNPNATFTVWRYLGWLPDAWLEVALLAAMQSLLNAWREPRPASARPPGPAWIELGGVTSISMFICMTNSPGGTNSETPLLTSWLFVLLGFALREAPGLPPGVSRPTVPRTFPALCAVACVLWVYTFGTGLLSLCWSTSPWLTQAQKGALGYAPRFDSDALGDLRVFDTGGEPPMPSTYADKVNDGLRLLRKLPGPCRVETLDFVNPFPFALQWPVTRGGEWCWHNGYSFSAASHPAAEEVFGNTDVLMIPKYAGETSSFETMVRIYAPYVKAHFGLVDQSDQWFVFRRR